MTYPVDTLKKATQATNALLDWFKSQEIAPFDSIIIMEFYIARMIVQNKNNGGSTEDKIKTLADNIYELVPFIEAAHL